MGRRRTAPDLLLPRGKMLEEARELLATAAQIPLNAQLTALIAASIQKARHADQRRVGITIGFALIAMAAIVLGCSPIGPSWPPTGSAARPRT